MATFLAVLKIAGLILLGLLAFVLVVLLLLLFVPVRFSLDAEIPDILIDREFVSRLKTESTAKARFHWFLHCVRGSFTYPGDNAFLVKVLFFQVLPGKEEPESAGTLPDEDFAPEAGQSVNAEQARPEKVSAKPEPEAEPKPETKPEEETKPEPKPEKKTGKKPDPERETETADTDGPAPTIARFLGRFFDILYLVLTKPYEVLWKIQYTISSVCDKIDDVRGFLDSSLFDRAKNVVLKQTLRLLRGMKPKTCDVRILCGAGDPALTADILAVFSTLYPLFGGGVRVEPDFDRRIAGCNAHIKGRITLFRVLTCAGIVYFNKDVRKAYKKAKRILRR